MAQCNKDQCDETQEMHEGERQLCLEVLTLADFRCVVAESRCESPVLQDLRGTLNTV